MNFPVACHGLPARTIPLRHVFSTEVPSTLLSCAVRSPAVCLRLSTAAEVRAEGKPYAATESVLLGDGPGAASLAVELPANYVRGSERATATVVGDVMGPTLQATTASETQAEPTQQKKQNTQAAQRGKEKPPREGLERLVRVPTGCGEQNMITLAPNVYVFQSPSRAVEQ